MNQRNVYTKASPPSFLRPLQPSLDLAAILAYSSVCKGDVRSERVVFSSALPPTAATPAQADGYIESRRQTSTMPRRNTFSKDGKLESVAVRELRGDNLPVRQGYIKKFSGSPWIQGIRNWYVAGAWFEKKKGQDFLDRRPDKWAMLSIGCRNEYMQILV